MWFRVDGVKFDTINKHMEWTSLSVCSEEEIRHAIRLAWEGVPPVYVGEIGLSGDQMFQHGRYPIQLRQVLGNVTKI